MYLRPAQTAGTGTMKVHNIIIKKTGMNTGNISQYLAQFPGSAVMSMEVRLEATGGEIQEQFPKVWNEKYYFRQNVMICYNLFYTCRLFMQIDN